MTVPGVTEDLVEKGAKALAGTWTLFETAPSLAEETASAVLAAVVPEVRREVAGEIATGILAQVGDGEWAGDYYHKAARIAREIGGVEQ